MNSRESFWPLSLFLALWALGSFGAAIIQLALPEWGGRGTNWGLSPGWQREISFWNLGLIAIILQFLRWGSADAKVWVARALVLLSVLFGTNHAVEVLRGGQTWFNAVGAAANYVAVLLGIGALVRSARPLRGS